MWAGFPLPLDGETLVVHPKHPAADMFPTPEPERTDEDGYRLRSSFFSDFRQSEVLIFEKDGKIEWGVRGKIHGLRHAIGTMGCADAWGIEQEARALQTLAELVPHHMFKRYLLAGAFLETSERSGVTYMFRKLRPTVALHQVNGQLRVLCALCLHPIAYYADTWAGAMCPTDDVLAHLMLMRGDEHMFWRRANQHHALMPEAGL